MTIERDRHADIDTHLEDSSPTRPLDDSSKAPFTTRRFEIGRRLGSGGFGDVYEARDRTSGSIVALKLLRHVDATSLLHFKREFRRVAELVHPNLIRLYELFEEDDRWFFTMELAHGTHMLDYLRAQPRGRHEPALRSAFSQLATAIEVLHGVGIVHRDIKPSNVMVERTGRVVLLDFGIAKEIALTDDRATSQLVGTPDYLAPERLERMSAREPSDWYSLGVMLYEALTGTLPFEGGWLEIMKQKQERDAEAPHIVASDVPRDLSDLCMALLDRTADRRPRAVEIRARLADHGPVELTGSPLIAAPANDTSPLVARTAELDTLRRAFDRASRGRPVAVHVTGPSGIGKTSLVQHFLAEISRQYPSAIMLAGACHEQESVPFNALDELVDRLSDYVEHLRPGRAILLPSQIAYIGRLFPVFTRASRLAVSFGDAGLADPVELRRQAFTALRSMLGRLCDRDPLVIAIDDLQWADRDSGAFLQELLRGPDAPPLLLVLTYRPQPPGSNDLIDHLRQAHEAATVIDYVTVPLTELSPADGADLVRRLLNRTSTPTTDETVQSILADADGSPFLIHRLANRLATDPDRLHQRSDVIAEELGRFTPAHRRLIEIVAVAGQPVPADVAVKAALGAASETNPSIDLGHLFAVRMLQMQRRGHDTLLDIYHDRIRKQLLDGLPAAARTSLHRALVEALEAIRPHESERLAYHCELGGQSNEASAHALAAARDAGRALAFDKAVDLYRRALALGTWDLAARQRIELELAEALASAGRGPESAQVYLTSAEGVTGIDNVRYRVKAADQYLRTGYLAEGQSLLHQLFDEVHERWSDRPAIIIASMLAHRLRGRLLLKRGDHDGPEIKDEREIARMEVLWAAAVGLSMFDPFSSAEYSARHLVLALKTRNVYRIALAIAGEATQYAHHDGGRDGRPQQLLQTAMRYARRSGAIHAVAFVHCMSGIASFLAGRWSESAAESERALKLLREHCIGVSWEVATAASFMCASHVFRGRLSEHARLLPTFVADARSRGDIYTADVLPALTLSWVQQLVVDNPAAATKDLPPQPLTLSRIRWRVQDVNALAARADIATYTGNVRGAWRLMDDHWPSVTRSLMIRVITIRVLLYMTRAKSALALAVTPDVGDSERASLLRAAEDAVRAMERTKCGWALALALALRAGIASCRGEEPASITLLERAAADLQAFELMPWYHAARWHLAACRERQSGERTPPDDWWIAERIAQPHRIAHLLIPGLWPERTR